ncbi:uncharacterized protein UTRI_10418_B [Ustilago trichophora]|uniref:Uncharacterized protein n=1 Tax=Ustilago trichophora TaxID=86804 RepID=A0A5C3ECR8_9BASI|nr:uncharacterized protein UTRI_10418_B [Ustilago trichophora]
MPFVQAARDMIGAAVTGTEVHEDAPSGIISLSWAFLVIPCIFLVAAFAWIMYNFSQPSEFPQANGFTEHDGHLEDEVVDDEKEQLLDAFNETQSHSSTRSVPHAPSVSSDSASGSAWKINGKFSTTSRGGSVYTSYPDPQASYAHSPKNSVSSSPNSKRASLTVDGKPKSVGSKAAKVLALHRDRMMHDLEKLDPIDRQELQRSSSRASDTRKSD